MTAADRKTVVVMSGGIDSTVLAHDMARRNYEVHGVSIHYGQRHHRELNYAGWQCERLDIPWKLVQIPGLRVVLGSSALTSKDIDVPEGHYEDESMKATVVPNRNMILLAICIGAAIDIGAERVAYGAHAGDHAIYPDCRPAFADAMEQAAAVCSYFPITLDRPFIHKTKADIVTLGDQLGVDFTRTWSCYQGGTVHCGKCGTCVERIEAFELAGVEDPTEYA